MIIAIYIILAIVIYYIGYILSLFSSVAYVDPEKIEHVAERLAGFRKKYLDEITESPRISLQLSIVFKSILLVLLTLLTILLANSLIDSLGIGADVGYLVGLAVVWLLYLVFMEILPRRQVLRIGDKDIVKYLPFYVSVYMIFKPLVRLYARLFVRRKIMRIPEDQKEDIIE
ncbi:MAG: hypothetical protein JSU69_03635, partial [Candidatus Zixiibacteriota bacterium]